MIGVGHYQIGSITVRILAWGDKAIDEAFFSDRLNEAFRMRQALRTDTRRQQRLQARTWRRRLPARTYCRHIWRHSGAAGPLAGNALYARHYSARTHCSSRSRHRQRILQIRNHTPYKAHLDPQNEYIIGAFSTNVAIENGLHFNIDWLKGQKTGFFVDQRDNRAPA